MEFTVKQDGECWVCGEQKRNMTMHHTIPQHLKPKKNVVVPVCLLCHEKINDTDLRGMYGFTHKIAITLHECERNLDRLTKRLERSVDDDGRKKTE